MFLSSFFLSVRGSNFIYTETLFHYFGSVKGSVYGSESTLRSSLSSFSFPIQHQAKIRMSSSFLCQVSVSVGPLGLVSYPCLLEMVRELQKHRAIEQPGMLGDAASYLDETGQKWEWKSDETARSQNLSLSLKHPSHLFLKDEFFQVGFLSFEKLFVFSCSFWRPNQ